MPSPKPPAPSPCFACLYLPPPADSGLLAPIAKEFSPRYEQHTGASDLVSIDVSGLDRLLGPPRTIGEELVRDASARGLRPHVALAATQTAAMVVALTRPGLTVVPRGDEAAAVAPVPIGVLEHFMDRDDQTDQPQNTQNTQKASDSKNSANSAISAVRRWGIRTLGELAALPADDLVARLGRPARVWQAIARGEDVRPLVPALPEERFDGSLELEWPIDELEPLSFVLTRLLEPLSTRLEQRDRGAAVLHVRLRLVTKEVHARRLELPSPIRDVRTLRTLALLDLESHPPEAAIDRVTVVIDPTPGRVLQHTLFTRPHPTPDQLSTLLARLGALMGQDRVGAAATIDSYRPGAFEMRAFATDHDHRGTRSRLRAAGASAFANAPADKSASLAEARPEPRRAEAGERRASRAESRDAVNVVSALRRCRQPVPARVVVEHDRPVRVTTDRRGFAGGAVIRSVGPWRVSGEWWQSDRFNRDEWDVALSDGAVYRIFRDRDTDAWFIDAIVD